MKKVSTDKAPKAIGPYSQAIISNNLLFISGQIPINPNTGTIEKDDIESQARQCFINIKGILNEVNLDFNNVIKTTVFLKDIKDFNIFNQIYDEYFISKPARSLVEVSNLPKNAKIEIEVIAEV